MSGNTIHYLCRCDILTNAIAVDNKVSNFWDKPLEYQFTLSVRMPSYCVGPSGSDADVAPGYSFPFSR